MQKMRRLRFCVIVFCCTICCCMRANSQQKDSITPAEKRHNIFHYAIKAIRKNSPDTANQQGKLNAKPEDAFIPFNGKTIKSITIKQYGFDKLFTDTTRRLQYFGTRLLNKLHRDSREWLIENNIYIQPNTSLNALLIADNERYLRTLDYIQDARIIVKPVASDTNSVTVEVITKDLFSLNAQLHNASSDRFRATVADANVRGTGQQVSLTSLVEGDRSAAYGAEVLYGISNIAGTFVNGTARYSAIGKDIAYKKYDEHLVEFDLERPLVSQYKHFAGGLLFGVYSTNNNYSLPDSIYYNYKHTVTDAWGGYNIGVKQYLSNPNLKLRKFVSVRLLSDKFNEQPWQVRSKLNYRYNDKTAVLGQLTLFRQEFYKTNYIYGFGNTEDIPIGLNISFTGGWFKQDYLRRAYTGIDANKYYFTQSGNIFQYFLRAGGFIDKNQLQDGIIIGGLSMFSHVFEFTDFKLRQYARISFTKQFNRTGLDALSIDNPFGLRYFRDDSTRGTQRISLHSETVFFINLKLLGFKFSPFAYGDASLLTPEKESLKHTGFYYGLGGGVRSRNENLVFGTTELRLIYFPRKTEFISNSFKAALTTNIRFRYNSTYVHKPDIIEYNSDSQYDIY